MRDPKRTADQLLRSVGFECIECPDGSLKTDVRLDEASRAARYLDSDRAYYEAAGRFLHEYKFADAQERRIWELHSQGHSHADIGPLVKLGRSTVQRKLAPLVVLMLRRFKLGRRPGRPENPDGYGTESARLTVRLSSQQAEALAFLARTCDLDDHEVARRCVLIIAGMLLSGRLAPDDLK